MIKNQRLQLWIISAICIILSGCLNRDMSDLEQKVADIKAKKNVKVAKLPTYKTTFQAIFEGGKNPFESFIQSKSAIGANEPRIKNKVCPRQPRASYRVRAGLEKFPLDSLNMKGSFRDQDGTLWALIVDPKGIMHTIKEGHFMGQNFGKVSVVSEEQIELEEKYPDEQVCWKTVDSKIKLIKNKR